MLAGPKERLHGRELGACELRSRVVEVRSGRQRRGIARPERAERRRQVRHAGKRDLELRRARVAGEDRVEFRQVFGQEERRERMLEKKRVAGPLAHEERGGRRVRPGVLRRDEVRGRHEARDVEAAAPEAREVRAVTETLGQPLDARAGRAGHLLGVAQRTPVRERVGAVEHSHAVAEVERQDDVVPREERAPQELRQGAQRRVALGDEHQILHVSVQDELVVGAALVELDELLRPRGQGGHREGAHSVSFARPRGAGGGPGRSSDAPSEEV